MLSAHRYSIWIEAEQWAPGQWTPADDNSDVVVTFDDGERGVATFFTYRNIVSLSQKNSRTGENLGGRYLAATDMILVDEVTRPRIEEVVADLLADGGFHLFFSRADSTTPARRTATDVERQFLAWLHIAFGILPVAHHGTGSAWWDFDYGPSRVEFAVIRRSGGRPTDWLLRIEDGTPTEFLDRVEEHFTAGSAVRRRVSAGRIRMQFKASALERPFIDQANHT